MMKISVTLQVSLQTQFRRYMMVQLKEQQHKHHRFTLSLAENSSSFRFDSIYRRWCQMFPPAWQLHLHHPPSSISACLTQSCPCDGLRGTALLVVVVLYKNMKHKSPEPLGAVLLPAFFIVCFRFANLRLFNLLQPVYRCCCSATTSTSTHLPFNAFWSPAVSDARCALSGAGVNLENMNKCKWNKKTI